MLQDPPDSDEKDQTGPYLRYRVPWRKRAKFWVLALVLSLVAAVAVVGIKHLWEAVDAAKAPGNLLQQDRPPDGMKSGPARKR